MKLQFLAIILLLSTTIFAQKEASIKAELKNNTYEKVYLENAVTGKKIDSTEIKDNKFSFKFSIKKSEILNIIFDDKHYFLYIPEPGEKSSVKLDINDLFSPEIKGSKNTALIYQTVAKNDKVSKKLEAYKLKLEEEKRDNLRKLIKNNPTSLASILFINQLDIETDFDSYKALSEGLKEHTDNELVASVTQKVKEASNLRIGTKAPEIALKTPEGKIVKLSSFKGKYVLIDFWAAWCRPCRSESPNMVKLYNKYHKKGFEIYSGSLDSEKDSWTKAIADDGLGAWTHVSDLKYWNSEAGRAYGVSSIPFTVLIDKKGKIIAKKLRGKNLEDKLAKIFKF